MAGLVAGAALDHLRAITRARRSVRPNGLMIVSSLGNGDFAFAVGHRCIAITRVAGTLNSAAAFSIVVASSVASPPGGGPLPCDRLE
jgi:hypothetical protein